MKLLPDFSFEEPYWNDNYAVIGIDEVGRGCLAGPVTAGGVYIDNTSINKNEWLTLGINDSKLLSANMRTKLASILVSKCVYATESIQPDLINKLGIVTCLKKAMASIVKKLRLSLPNKKIILLIDGLPISHIPYINDIPRVSIVKGDGKSISIAAASIIAKVERDLYMCNLAKFYPSYDWQENKGYGTLKHRTAISRFGISPHHRTLFVRKILSNLNTPHSL